MSLMQVAKQSCMLDVTHRGQLESLTKTGGYLPCFPTTCLSNDSQQRHPIPPSTLAVLEYSMENPLAITIEEARKIVSNEAKSKGWVRPGLSESQNPETVEILETLKRTRESLGDIIDV